VCGAAGRAAPAGYTAAVTASTASDQHAAARRGYPMAAPATGSSRLLKRSMLREVPAGSARAVLAEACAGGYCALATVAQCAQAAGLRSWEKLDAGQDAQSADDPRPTCSGLTSECARATELDERSQHQWLCWRRLLFWRRLGLVCLLTAILVRFKTPVNSAGRAFISPVVRPSFCAVRLRPVSTDFFVAGLQLLHPRWKEVRRLRTGRACAGTRADVRGVQVPCVRLASGGARRVSSRPGTHVWLGGLLLAWLFRAYGSGLFWLCGGCCRPVRACGIFRAVERAVLAVWWTGTDLREGMVWAGTVGRGAECPSILRSSGCRMSRSGVRHVQRAMRVAKPTTITSGYGIAGEWEQGVSVSAWSPVLESSGAVAGRQGQW
jgi:hypothetical protein